VIGARIFAGSDCIFGAGRIRIIHALPGIANGLRPNTAIALPIGVEAYGRARSVPGSHLARSATRPGLSSAMGHRLAGAILE
jgi:hypothetical protein